MCHWEASQRPMMIKTVWIGSRRHAILSQADYFDYCNIGTRKNRYIKVRDKIFSDDINDNDDDDLKLPFFDAEVQKIPIFRRLTAPKSSPKGVPKSPKNIAFDGRKEFIERNPLSERVLQWLDLAGQENFKFDLEKLLPNSCDSNALSNYGLEKSSHGIGNVKYSNDRVEATTTTTCETPDARIKFAEHHHHHQSKSACESKNLDAADVKYYEKMSFRVKRKKLHIFIPTPKNDPEPE